MCLGIPMRIVEPDALFALCEGRHGRRRIDLRLVGAQPADTWVLTFVDAAREVPTAERAAKIDQALQALESALAGDPANLDAFFPDLAGREPDLPAHLRPLGEER